MPRKPNIVWVMADDLGSPLSFTGTAGVKTPHIDGLASEGMFFSRYYATAASCAPSRTAILTGMYPTYLNAQHHHSEPDFPPPVKHLAQRLREDGTTSRRTSPRCPMSIRSSASASATSTGRASTTSPV